MNEFKSRLKIEKSAKEETDNFKKRVTDAIYKAISDIETTNEEQKIQKLEYIVNLNKIMDNYEDLRPILTKYFSRRVINDKEK